MGPLSESHIYRNLVFEGGGTLIVLYTGAAQSLEKHGILSQIRRTAGASTGSVMSLLVSLKKSADEIKTTLDDLDWAKIPQKHEGEARGKWSLDNLTGGNIESFERLFKKYGYYSNTFFWEWLEDVVGSVTGNKRATFADLRAAGYHDLHVIVSNVSKHAREVFCADNTPDVAVADAVRMSTSIPLYFEAMQFDGTTFGKGDFYVDGGFTDNYPLWLFDHEQYAADNPHYVSDVNWETLGFCHFTPEDASSAKPVTSLLTFVENLMGTIAKAQNLPVEDSEVMHHRTVSMSDCGASQVDFDMKPGDENYNRLFETGVETTEKFLRTAKLPPSVEEC